MNSLAVLLALITGGLLLLSPKRWGVLGLLMAAAYVPSSQQIELGPLHLPVIRLLISVGFLRVIMKGETLAGQFNWLDRLMIIWTVWAVGSSVFHESGLSLTRFGEVYTDLGIYFLFRVFLRGPEDIRDVFKIACVLLLPVAVGMILEKMTGKNVIASLFGDQLPVMFRHGHYRARGPYANAILGGTTGAVCFPMALYLWRQDRKVALAGLAGAAGIVFASGSSGPAMTAMVGMGAMAFWRIRQQLCALRWLAFVLIIALDLVMEDPVYFLVERIDIGGGSTGWYRAALIQSAFRHVSEWWVVGTDVTVHWMPPGTSGVVGAADITNYYIQMGVWGGFPLMFLFIGILYLAFSAVGKQLQASKETNGDPLLIWTLGSLLFAHAVTFWSVSYFDPASVLPFYLVLAAIGSRSAVTLVDSVARHTNGASESGPLPKAAALV